ncbi:MAG: MBL fold metallo-hydrolase [Candidatus Binatia bacterium]
MKPVALIIASLAFGTLSMVACAPSLNTYKDYMLPASARAEAGKKNLTVMFLGVTTLLFDDGETAIMTDGYFTRPVLSSLASIKPDKDMIARSLQRAGVKSLAAVIPLHTHFDHALDSPVVALQTGALLVGSSSTANIGRGYGFPDNRIRTVRNGETLRFGRFSVTFVVSAHLPINFALGEITAPLSVPARASDFKMGANYALFIEHDGRTILIQGGAGFVAGGLKGRKADVVYLGIGGLGTRDASYKEAYWQEIVRSVGARRVIPVHWDDFYKSLDEPLAPFPDFDASMQFLLERGKKDGVDVRLPSAWTWAEPFLGM